MGHQYQRWLRGHATALKLAARHNAKAATLAREQSQALIAELLAESPQPL